MDVQLHVWLGRQIRKSGGEFSLPRLSASLKSSPPCREASILSSLLSARADWRKHKRPLRSSASKKLTGATKNSSLIPKSKLSTTPRQVTCTCRGPKRLPRQESTLFAKNPLLFQPKKQNNSSRF